MGNALKEEEEKRKTETPMGNGHSAVFHRPRPFFVLYLIQFKSILFHFDLNSDQ